MNARSLIKSSLTALIALTTLAPAQANDQVFAQVFTDWLVLVKDNASAKACAVEVAEKTGYEVRDALELVGILLVTTPTADASALDSVSCVEAYERDGYVELAM